MKMVEDFGNSVALRNVSKDIGVSAWEFGGQWAVQQSRDADCDRPMPGSECEFFASREAAMARAEALFEEVAA
jgi:hypothetical protein